MPAIIDQIEALNNVTLPDVGQVLMRVDDVDGDPAYGGATVVTSDALGAETEARINADADLTTSVGTIVESVNDIYSAINGHTGDTANPHATTAVQVGAYTTTQVDTLLAGKAATSHTQSYTTITGLGTAATAAIGTTAGTVPTVGTDPTYLPKAGGTLSGNLTGSGTLTVVGSVAFGYTGPNNGEGIRGGQTMRLYDPNAVLFMGGNGANAFMFGAFSSTGGPNGLWGFGPSHQRGNSNPQGFRILLGGYDQPSIMGNYGDVSGAVGCYFDNKTTLTASDAKLWAWRNGGVEKASITATGGAAFAGRVTLGNTLGLVTINTATTPGTVTGQIAWGSAEHSVIAWDGGNWLELAY